LASLKFFLILQWVASFMTCKLIFHIMFVFWKGQIVNSTSQKAGFPICRNNFFTDKYLLETCHSYCPEIDINLYFFTFQYYWTGYITFKKFPFDNRFCVWSVSLIQFPVISNPLRRLSISYNILLPFLHSFRSRGITQMSINDPVQME
jgi:hypothetical protein